MGRRRIARINHAEDADQGAIAVLVAILVVVLFGITAFALDISTQLSKKQTLQNTLDSAALAGAAQLDGTSAGPGRAALAIASTFGYNDASLNPSSSRTTFYCVVPASATAGVADFTAIPTVCQPGAAPWTSSSYPASSYTCNSTTCYLPCSAASVTALTCIPNAVGVGASKPVTFTFGPAIGIGQGSTGAVVSVACSSRCGSPVTNPADIVVIADRSGSMNSYMNDETTAISEALKFVGNSATQHVALGTVGYTDTSSNACSSSTNASMVKPMTTNPSVGTAQPEAWVPIGLSHDFTGATLGTLNPSSSVVKALNCLRTATANSGTGSWMATPLKAASNYLLGRAILGSGNGQLPRSNVSKAIIFETDQQPNENPAKATTTVTTPQTATVRRRELANNVATITTTANHQVTVGSSVVVSGVDTVFNGTWTVTAVTGTTLSYRVVHANVTRVNSSGTVAYSTTTTTTTTPASVVCDYTANPGCGPDPLADNANIGNSDATQACRNFKYVADRAKALGIVIAMISYNPGSSANCQSLLRLSHDPIASQVGGAYLSYSAANSTQLAAQFKAAVSAVTSNARLVRLP